MGHYGIVLLMSWAVIGSASINRHSTPDFSGTWMLADSNAGRSGEISGAVVNCGPECTITQTSETLTVARPAAPDGKKAPDGVIALDGRPMAGNTTAKWDGEKLVLTRAVMPSYAVTQTLTLDGGKLVIGVAVGENRVGPFRLIYTRR